VVTELYPTWWRCVLLTSTWVLVLDIAVASLPFAAAYLLDRCTLLRLCVVLRAKELYSRREAEAPYQMPLYVLRSTE
jgi:hypothetical protein